jgi:hypothetical protein
MTESGSLAFLYREAGKRHKLEKFRNRWACARWGLLEERTKIRKEDAEGREGSRAVFLRVLS